MNKTIYVVGGTNGVGKSTIREDLFGPTIPYINADFIAKELKAGQASLMHAELARQYGSDQIKKYIAASQSFALENNLHENNTFKWLGEMQKKGYRIELIYIGVNDLQITTTRIQERVKRGEHHVPPNEVFARYENGLNLLRHYFSMPDKIVFIDNTNKRYTCLEVEKGKILFQMENPPGWINEFVSSLTKDVNIEVKALDTIDDVKKAYEQLKQRVDTLKDSFPPDEKQHKSKNQTKGPKL